MASVGKALLSTTSLRLRASDLNRRRRNPIGGALKVRDKAETSKSISLELARRVRALEKVTNAKVSNLVLSHC